MNTSLSASKPLRLLLVDDESAVLCVLKLALRAEGHVLTTAMNGTDALRCFGQGDFDLVVTDRNMPGMSGEALAEEIKRRKPEMPILLISGHPPQTLDTAKFNLILGKPFTRSQLLTAIGALT